MKNQHKNKHERSQQQKSVSILILLKKSSCSSEKDSNIHYSRAAAAWMFKLNPLWRVSRRMRPLPIMRGRYPKHQKASTTRFQRSSWKGLLAFPLFGYGICQGMELHQAQTGIPSLCLTWNSRKGTSWNTSEYPPKRLMKLTKLINVSKSSPAAGCRTFCASIEEHVTREECPELKKMRTVGEWATPKWGRFTETCESCGGSSEADT